jgi:hypothetical protein
MDDQSPGTAPVTKQDLRDLKDDLRSEFSRSFDAMNWKILAVAGLNVGGLITGIAALLKPGPTSSALHAIGKVVGLS